MKLPFLSNYQIDHQYHNPLMSSSSSSSSTWPWPSCTQTRTLSFRASNDFKTNINNTTMSVNDDELENPSKDHVDDDDDEAVIQGLRSSERLFFVEPGETSSILEEATINNHYNNDNFKASKGTITTQYFDGGDVEELVVKVPFKESVALSLESQNPYLDFKASMEEMVEAHGIKDWEGLEELLCCYLKMNGKDNHSYIVGAFVDLLLSFAFNNFASSTTINTTKTTSTIINNNDNDNSTSVIKSCRCSSCDSPYSPLSFCNTSSSSCYSSSSNSSSISSSSTPNYVTSSIGVTSDQEIETPCLSSLLESTEEEETNEEDDDDDVSS